MKNLKFEIYKDSKKDYRWRLKSANGKIIADCAEGYKRKKTIVRFIEDVQYDQIFFTCVDNTSKESQRTGFNESYVMREHYQGQIMRSK
jgi:uncharacterized protein YegP (UPF0339 family)